MSRATRSAVVRWGLRLGVVVAVLAGVQYLSCHLSDPGKIAQARWYQIATQGPDGRAFTKLPKQHTVVVKRLDCSPIAVAAGYLPPPIGNGGQVEQQGSYDSKTRKINVCGKLSRLEASLPVGQGMGLLYRTVRHEYGHAFLDDWMRSKGMRSGAIMNAAFNGGRLTPGNWPKEMQPVIEEFLVQRPDVYGNTYFTQTFNEYFAESYARFVSGKTTPSHMTAFLRSQCRN